MFRQSVPVSQNASPTAETAQETFKRMLRDVIAPALRMAGMRGSGGVYSIPSETHWVQLGFQRSQFNTAESVKFTVNCKVVRKDVWSTMYEERPYIGKTPRPNVRSGDFEWASRIGSLMPSGEDTWWSLGAGQETAGVAQEVLEAIRSFALPALTSAQST